MIFRATTEADLDRVLPLLVPAQAGAWVDADAYRRGLGTGEHRPGWTWVAEDRGELLAVAVWWGSPGQYRPSVLNTLHTSGSAGIDRATLAADLLAAAHAAHAAAGQSAPPDYHVLLPADWREQPAAVDAVAWRRAAAARAGLTEAVERLRYEWTAGTADVPEPSTRLRLRAEPDDEVFVDLFRRALTGTLDAGSRQEAEELGADAQARADVAFYRDDMQGERSWWRVAENADGVPVGFALPSRNTTSHVVGYLGVLPEHRGHGYVDDLLAGITRFLAVDTGAEVIRADTDLANHPMAAAFARLGYRNFARRLVLSAPR